MKIRGNKIKTPKPELTKALRAGRRALDGIQGVVVLEDFFWDSSSAKWFLRIRLSPPEIIDNEFIPKETEWFIRLDPLYPRGKIKIKPAVESGIKHTFPHQAINLLPDNKERWRAGDICVDKPESIFGRQAFTNEPESAEERLSWHIRRSLSWLEDASQGQLFKPGNPFELPEFSSSRFMLEKVAFAESEQSFQFWEDLNADVGVVEFSELPGLKSTNVATTFVEPDTAATLPIEWGYVITDRLKKRSNPLLGIWIKLKNIPILPPWQSPITVGELRDVLAAQNVDLDECLSKIYSRSKIQINLSSIVLIGFPIPENIGERNKRYHWQGLRLPDLKVGDSRIDGHRKGRKAVVHYNKQILHKDLRLDWLKSENWYPDQIQARGSLPESVKTKNILLIGAGAVGSSIAELLVRGGVKHMAVVDPDILITGNLVRHTLNMLDVDYLKSESLANRLNSLSPHACVDEIEESFLTLSQQAIDRVKECDLIIDCTGEDSVLEALSNIQFDSSVQYFSFSVNRGARRFYSYFCKGEQFNLVDFNQKLKPWAHRDFQEKDLIKMPHDGIGCWSPVFPARSDDIWMFASTGVKHLSDLTTKNPEDSVLDTFEQAFSETGEFLGVTKISQPSSDE